MLSFLKTGKKQQGQTPQCSAVIAAAGLSQRMGGEDKLFVEIGGAPVLAHTLSAFQACEYIDEIIVVSHMDRIQLVCDICKRYDIAKASKIMVGGPTRRESVLNGVMAVSKKARLIAIHDGARPCADTAVIKRAIDTAAKYHAAAPAVAVSSTIKTAKGDIVTGTVDRSNLFEIQTPQVFTSDLIKAALKNAITKAVNITDDCMAVELIGAPVHLTEGSRSNIKITTREDLIMAEAILAMRKGR